MEMTPQEIVGSYRRATNKSEQIKILSELNACSKEDIKKILEDQGVTVKTPGRKKKSAFRKAEVAPVQQFLPLTKALVRAYNMFNERANG